MSITIALRRAAKIQEKIDALRTQLAELLAKARSEISSAPKNEVPALLRGTGRRGRPPKIAKAPQNGNGLPVRRGRKPKAAVVSVKQSRKPDLKNGSPLAGRKRSSSPSGPLAPAVVKVLEAKNKPMNVRDILDGLVADGYKFNTPEPRKNLAARIYRLSGVKQAAPGLFALA
jgi:hypothetical protein